MPIIGSLNGVSTGGWTRYAKLIEEAGADALCLGPDILGTWEQIGHRNDRAGTGADITFDAQIGCAPDVLE